MRHVLLALLIALLPLRGWVGDAMAMALVTHPAAHAAAHTLAPADAEPSHCAEHTAHTGSAGHDEHAGHGMEAQALPHAPGAAESHASTDSSDHPTHQHKACDVCNGPAMALSGVAASGLPLPSGLQVIATVRFASTVLPQGIKPPIS
jgi:hypothetical protein